MATMTFKYGEYVDFIITQQRLRLRHISLHKMHSFSKLNYYDFKKFRRPKVLQIRDHSLFMTGGGLAKKGGGS